MSLKKQVAAVVLAALLCMSIAPRVVSPAFAAPAASTSQSAVGLFDKTRFVLHMGFAYYAFHHFVYAKFHHKVTAADGTVSYTNEFAAGTPGRTLNLVKAAVAILFTVHELKVAYGIANTSSSGTLRALVKPINGLMGLASTEYAKLRGCQSTASASDSGTMPTALPTADTGTSTTTVSGCQYSDKDISGMNSAVDSLTKVATSHGLSLGDKSFPIPGLS